MGNCTTACEMDSFKDATQRDPQDISMVIDYNEKGFVLPSEILFNHQSTFTKIEKVSREFCEKNQISINYAPLVSRIIAYRHEFLFQEVYKKIPLDERQMFLNDLSTVQHDLMDSFYHNFVKNGGNRESNATLKIISLPKVIKAADLSAEDNSYLKEVGLIAIKKHKVAVVLMCAGFSSRFEGVDKFMIPLKLDTDRTLNLLDLTFMRIRANTDCLDLPVIVSCNEFNIEKIQIYIKQRDYYGFDPSKFRFIEAYSLAVFDSKGKYCVTGKFRLIRRPSGTAVTVEELLRGSIYQFLKDTGVEYVQINGMENLMQNPCDPVMIGLIINEHKKLVAKCTHSCFHYEPLNRYFKDRKSGSIELLNTNEIDNNNETVDSLPIAMNSLVFELNSLKDIIDDYNNSLFLAAKYHVIYRKQLVYDIMTGILTPQDCCSFEKDVRDIITCVNDPILYRVSRNKQYAPMFTIDKEYSFIDALRHFKTDIDQEVVQQIRPSSSLRSTPTPMRK